MIVLIASTGVVEKPIASQVVTTTRTSDYVTTQVSHFDDNNKFFYYIAARLDYVLDYLGRISLTRSEAGFLQFTGGIGKFQQQ